MSTAIIALTIVVAPYCSPTLEDGAPVCNLELEKVSDTCWLDSERSIMVCYENQVLTILEGASQ